MSLVILPTTGKLSFMVQVPPGMPEPADEYIPFVVTVENLVTILVTMATAGKQQALRN
jgi:hypothetical protein